MISLARQLQAKCIEENMDFYVVFIDLTKAFNTVSRDPLAYSVNVCMSKEVCELDPPVP